MPRGASTTVENNFVRGLITEFTAMNFPENAVTDADNCIFSEQGEVTRRLGMEQEDGGTDVALAGLTNDVGTLGAISEFIWQAVGNDQTLTFHVQQIGTTVSFFAIGDTISGGLQNFNVNLANYSAGATAATIRDSHCQFTSGKGYLFIAHPYCNPIYVSYDPATGFTASMISIEVRDLKGLAESVGIDERPTVLTDVHTYNLYNQGWYFEALVGKYLGSKTKKNVLTAWAEQRSDYPSNADIWWVYKSARELAWFEDQYVEEGVTPFQVNLGNTPAPKGHYIYNAFYIDRGLATGVSGLSIETAGLARPSCIEFFAGRVFYAGVSKDGYADTVYFSQIIEGEAQFGKCYQQNDPTSEITFDLVDSDGGTISLPLIQKIISMKVIGDALVIQGINGHYVIRGSANEPFKATNYTVSYVSTIGCTSSLSVVAVDDGLMWINNDAIYILGPNNTGFDFNVQNASENTIQTLVDNIPSNNIPYIKGWYNKKDQIVRWLFSDNEDAGYTYNRILELNLTSKAFYTHTIDETAGPVILGIVATIGSSVTFTQAQVTASGGNVVDALGASVTSTVASTRPNSEVFKFCYRDGSNFSFAGLTGNYVDWGSEEYESYFVSGHRVRGELLRMFNSSTIALTMRKITGSRVNFKAIWDWGARTSSVQQVYRENSYQDYVVRRLKVRGKGKSLQLRFDSVSTNPFTVCGWSTFDTGGQMP